MSKEIAVDVDHDQTRVAVLENNTLVELYIEKNHRQRIAGNIYKGKVVNVLPGMEAAFVDIGLEKNAFLYVDDAISNNENFDYDEDILDNVSSVSIKDVLRQGQEIIVQVIKEPFGTKGARVSTNITLPGRYLVLMPTVNYIGVSRRIESEEERTRLRELADEMKRDGLGLIVRTVAEGKTREEICSDMKFLKKLWKKIQRKNKSGPLPKLIYKDLNLIHRIVRDLFSNEIQKLYINSKSEYDKVLELLYYISPKLKDRVVLYNKKEDIYDYFSIEEEIENSLNKKVWLKCGGYLVIDHTEALTSIDVNTGKYVGKTDLEATVLKTNMEAAIEIAKQLKLRDIGGIIIIDFIDMNTQKHKDMVLDALETELEKDKTKTHVLGLTKLGLVEMTRKRVKKGLDEMFMKKCPYCDGKGRIISEETMGKKVKRELKKIFSSNKTIEAVLIEVHPNVAAVAIGSGGEHLNYLEEEYNKSIYIKGKDDMHPEEITIKAMGTKEKVESLAMPVNLGDEIILFVEDQHVSNKKDGIARIDGYVVDIENAGNLVGKRVKVKINRAFRTYAKAKIIEKIRA